MRGLARSDELAAIHSRIELRVKELIHRRKRDFRYAYVTSNNFYTLVYFSVCFIVSLKFTREEGRKYYSLLLSMIGPLLILNIILSGAKRIKLDTRGATSKKTIGLVEKFSLKSRLKSTFVSEISYRIEDFSKIEKVIKLDGRKCTLILQSSQSGRLR